MATTTLQNLRREFGHYLGYAEILGKDGEAWTTTSTIGAGTTVTSTELTDYGFDDLDTAGDTDDLFQNHWVIIHGTNNAQTVRRIKSYDASAGTITVSGTNLSAESGNVDFEIHKYSPTMLREVLNSARVQAFPMLHVPISKSIYTSENQYRYELPSSIKDRPTSIRLEDGIAAVESGDNILTNPGFETWTDSSTPGTWTVETNLTATQEELTTNPFNYAVFRGQYSAKITNGTTGTQRAVYESFSSPGTYSGQRINFQIWVHSNEASTISTYIKLNSTEHLGSQADGGQHQGSGWELLTHYEDSATTLSTLEIGVEMTAAASTGLVVYLDEAVATVGGRTEAQESGNILMNWQYVPEMESTTDRTSIHFPYNLPNLKLLRIQGKNYLTEVSSETDTMEIAKPRTELLYAFAAAELYQRLAQASATFDTNVYAGLRNRAFEEIQRKSIHSQPLGQRRILVPDWSY